MNWPHTRHARELGAVDAREAAELVKWHNHRASSIHSEKSRMDVPRSFRLPERFQPPLLFSFFWSWSPFIESPPSLGALARRCRSGRLELELESFYSITTFIRAITSLLQIRQVAHLRSTTCSLQGLSPTQRSTLYD